MDHLPEDAYDRYCATGNWDHAYEDGWKKGYATCLRDMKLVPASEVERLRAQAVALVTMLRQVRLAAPDLDLELFKVNYTVKEEQQ